MLPYRYGLLKPQRAPGSRVYNAIWLGHDTLGVEVTELELAASCGLGNIDPQHLGGDQGTAAIDAALLWPLPSAGAALVTIRPDADAVGAMAVLTLRQTGAELSQDARARIDLIGGPTASIMAPGRGCIRCLFPSKTSMKSGWAPRISGRSSQVSPAPMGCSISIKKCSK